MSQWGAYGMAHRRLGVRRHPHALLPGRSSRSEQAAGDLRIGLTQDRKKIHIGDRRAPCAWGSGNKGPLVGEIPAGRLDRAHPREEVPGARRHGHPRGGQGLGRHRHRSLRDLRARRRSAFVHVPDRRRNLQPRLPRVQPVPRRRGWRERLILPVELGLPVRIGEVPSSWPARPPRPGRRRPHVRVERGEHAAPQPCNCALYDAAIDQVYSGWNKEDGADGDRWVDAVDDTDEPVVAAQGKPIQAFYTASRAVTRTTTKTSGTRERRISWLPRRCDPGDFTGANPNASGRERSRRRS